VCFSATASFVAGGVLLPAGGVALLRAFAVDRRYLLLAAFPVIFGIQQIGEGFVWLGLDAGATPRNMALFYLFFAYLLWLVVTPLAAFVVEDKPRRRRFFFAIAGFGAVFGLSLYGPLLLFPDWLTIGTARGSIVYDTRLIHDVAVPKDVLRAIYVAVICLPLLASTADGVRGFGILVTLSVAVAFLIATHAFTSVWCYFAAVVSAWVVWMIHRLPHGRPTAAG
jgi:hypothetical protein